MNIYEFYIPWDVDLFFVGISQLMGNLGTIINVGFWGFLIITAVYLIIKIAGSLFS